VLWCPAGRSQATQQRAEDAGLVAAESMAELVDRSALLTSTRTVVTGVLSG